MDAKHIICLKINGEWHQLPAIYPEAEFDALMDLIGWNVPLGMKIYHFHGNENERNPVMRTRPKSDVDIEALLRADTDKHITYLDVPHSRIMKVQKLLGNLAIAYCPTTGCLHLIDLSDSRYRQAAQYKAVPISLADAAEFVNRHHRHCVGTKWHKFSVALETGGEIAGVVIASTPKSPVYDKQTLELNRVCAKPQYHNACSKLIGMVLNIGRTMGYHTFISYTLMEEDGASLRAAGFEFAGYTEDSKGWSNPSRPRKLPERYPLGRKKRWILHTTSKGR